MKQIIGGDAAIARQSARHKLFVEGATDEEIDPTVLREFLTRNGLSQIEVVATGGCSNIRNAADALLREHPTYYFLTDRDAQDDDRVEESWANFPDLTKKNLLIWRKRELENYFIDPDYIKNSKWLKPKVTEAKLRAAILKEAQLRLYMDAVNLVLLELREKVCAPFPKHFADVSRFRTETAAMSILTAYDQITDKLSDVQRTLEQSVIEASFHRYVTELSGGQIPLQYGPGTWLNRMSGKEIFSAIINSCFAVQDAQGNPVTGKKKATEVAKDLLRRPKDEQPSDFVTLLGLLETRVRTNPA
jgi:hypothetical protein